MLAHSQVTAGQLEYSQGVQNTPVVFRSSWARAGSLRLSSVSTSARSGAAYIASFPNVAETRSVREWQALGYCVCRDLLVQATYDDGIFVTASDPFETYAIGQSSAEAIENFVEVLVEDYLWLNKNEAKLGEHLQSQLTLLRQYLKPVSQ